MLTDRATLQHLIRATRRKYVERELCCPDPACGRYVLLIEGRYFCGCGKSYGTLAELGVRA